MRDWNNNQPSLLGLYSDYPVPVVVVGEDGRRDVRDKRWGMPTPKKKLLDAAAKRAAKLRVAQLTSRGPAWEQLHNQAVPTM